MYSNEQVTSLLNSHTRDIAKVQESAASAHKRISENEELTKGIHLLAREVAENTTEMKLLTGRMDKTFERLEAAQKSQGERFGEAINQLKLGYEQIKRNEAEIEKQAAELKEIVMKPAKKWETMIGLLGAGLVGAVFTFLVTLLEGG